MTKQKLTPAGDREWFKDHDNLVLLTSWMAGEDMLAINVADAVEKPWRWYAEFIAAKHNVSNAELTSYLDDDGNWTTLETRILADINSTGTEPMDEMMGNPLTELDALISKAEALVKKLKSNGA